MFILRDCTKSRRYRDGKGEQKSSKMIKLSIESMMKYIYKVYIKYKVYIWSIYIKLRRCLIFSEMYDQQLFHGWSSEANVTGPCFFPSVFPCQEWSYGQFSTSCRVWDMILSSAPGEGLITVSEEQLRTCEKIRFPKNTKKQLRTFEKFRFTKNTKNS